MQRREFVIGGAGALAGLAAGALGADTLVELVSPGPTPEVLRFDTWLGGMNALEPVGRYVAEHAAAAQDADTTALFAAAGAALEARLGVEGGGAERVDTLERRLRAAVETDFEEGRLCEVDGWQLSQTECDLALVFVQRFAPRDARPDAPVEGHIVTVEAWGPQSTERGQRFNQQSDGHSGIWFRAPGAPAWVQVVIDGDPMPTFVNGDVVTSGLHGGTQDRVLAEAGSYAIVLLDEMRGVVQPVGTFEVREPSRPARLADGRESSVFCEVDAWGPQETRAGTVVNELPDGAIGLWVRIGCSAPGARLRARGVELETSIRKDGRVTGRLPPEMVAEPGEIDLSLHDPESGETLPIGVFTVRP